MCGSFWLLPFALKLARNLSAPAFYSFCALISVSVFGAYYFGGVSSPFLPWFLTAQMLGFFYLSNRPFVVLGIITMTLAAFAAAYWINGSFPERVAIEQLSTAGMISVCAATLYSSMMAIYYAYRDVGAVVAAARGHEPPRDLGQAARGQAGSRARQ